MPSCTRMLFKSRPEKYGPSLFLTHGDSGCPEFGAGVGVGGPVGTGFCGTPRLASVTATVPDESLIPSSAGVSPAPVSTMPSPAYAPAAALWPATVQGMSLKE